MIITKTKYIKKKKKMYNANFISEFYNNNFVNNTITMCI